MYSICEKLFSFLNTNKHKYKLCSDTETEMSNAAPKFTIKKCTYFENNKSVYSYKNCNTCSLMHDSIMFNNVYIKYEYIRCFTYYDDMSIILSVFGKINNGIVHCDSPMYIRIYFHNVHDMKKFMKVTLAVINKYISFMKFDRCVFKYKSKFIY